MNTPLFKASKLLEILERKDYPTELVGWGLDYYLPWTMGCNLQNRYAIVDKIQCVNPQPSNGIREICTLETTPVRRSKWQKVQRELKIPSISGKTYKTIK